jgi:hypothetical protein
VRDRNSIFWTLWGNWGSGFTEVTHLGWHHWISEILVLVLY